MADRRVPAKVKATLTGVAAYLAMPFDLIPDFIPVLGYLDDLVLVILVFDGVLNQIDEAIVAEYWKGDPATLQRLQTVSRRAARFIPVWIKGSCSGAPYKSGSCRVTSKSLSAASRVSIVKVKTCPFLPF